VKHCHRLNQNREPPLWLFFILQSKSRMEAGIRKDRGLVLGLDLPCAFLLEVHLMETQEFRQIKIRRDGEKDLRFEGIVLAEADNHFIAGQDQSRWRELTLYETAGGKYVLSEVQRTCWQGERDGYTAHVFDEPGELAELLEGDDGDFSGLDKELVNEAAEADDKFRDLLTEEIE
jgi:hypothetical protein